MSSAFRFHPASARSGRLIRRPRLTTALRDRFDHRVTVVAAPAGAGKSTALALAIESNRLDPYGEDIWLGVDTRDNEAQHFLLGLYHSLGMDGGESTKLDLQAIADEIWHRAPHEVALIIDDVHLLGSDDVVALLNRLLVIMPTNGHLILVGRSIPNISLARLRAHGEVLSLDAEDLAFDDSEVHRLAKMHPESDVAVAELPRHAALADVRLSLGSQAQIDFLWEEVLQPLDEARVTALANLSTLLEFDEAIALAVSGGEYTADQLVFGLPLVAQTESGAFRLHSLLAEALISMAPAHSVVDATASVADLEVQRGNIAYAVELRSLAADIPGAIELARRLVAMPLLRRSYAELLTVRRILNEHCPELALTALFEFQYQAAQHHAGANATKDVASLLATASLAKEQGDTYVESVALFRSFAAAEMAVIDAGEELVERLTVLAQTDAAAVAFLRHVHFVRALRSGHYDAAVQLIADAEQADSIIDRLYSADRWLDIGYPEKVHAGLTQDGLRDLQVGGEVLVGFAMWLRGEGSPETALEFVAAMMPTVLAQRVVLNSVAMLGSSVMFAVTAGNFSSATRFLALGDDLVRTGAELKTRQYLLTGRAALVAVERSDVEAGEILGESFEQVPFGLWPSRHHLAALGLIYMTRPETREVLDAGSFGHALTVGIRAAQALVEMRATGSVVLAAELPWDQVHLLRAQVLPHHLCELALGALQDQRAAANDLLSELPEMALLLRRVISTATDAVRHTAERRLERLPVAPQSKLRIETFGGLRLIRDGEVIADDVWVRRSRVRQLLAILVEHGTIDRTAVLTMLWPDLGERQASSNLSTNLSHLHRILEPNRPTGSAPYYVRLADGQLILHPQTAIDAHEFEAAIHAAIEHDRAGATATALEEYVTILDLYCGSFLSGYDVSADEANRIRYASLALGGYCRVGELIAARGEPEEALQWATKAIRLNDLSERAGRLFAQCLSAMQDRAAAAVSLDGLVERLAETGLTPESETVALRERLAG